jgi:hypothetical protein
MALPAAFFKLALLRPGRGASASELLIDKRRGAIIAAG